MAEPKKPSDLLGGILKSARTLASRSDVSRALEEVLGAETAARCRVVGESRGKRNAGGRLIVEVDSAPLYAELQGFRREEIRDALNQRLDRPRIAELLFRLHRTSHV